VPGSQTISGPLRTELSRFVALLTDWQRVHNLVGRAELHDIWTRHIQDSLQLLNHAPGFTFWVDLGSGAGFPGLVVAIASRGDASKSFVLVESNHKKAAFLRTAARELGLKVQVAAERIEAHGSKIAERADIVSARALAPLPILCSLAAPYLHPESTLLCLKGQDFQRELEEASLSWDFDVVSFQSETDSAGRILAIRHLSPKVRRP
jgi:16S rRNA (guanine527-N7)-methyltransferase